MCLVACFLLLVTFDFILVAFLTLGGGVWWLGSLSISPLVGGSG